ncbi:MAG: site-specific integrase [Lyngbya sp. HA4199-MV5]|jgi:integrase|nr:site-specific integrase [Lyngbya sp. HA4199-MV5]
MAKRQREPNFLEAHAATNLRLKTGKVKLSVVITGETLAIQGTLPDRYDLSAKPHQQKVALGLPNTVEGLKQAEAEARVVRRLLNKGQFDWSLYQTSRNGQITQKKPAQWIADFEEKYFTERARTSESQTTWDSDYKPVFKKLEDKVRLTVGLLESIIKATKPDTKTRLRTCMALQALANMAGLKVSFKKLQGKYSPRKAAPRNLPSDTQVVEGFYKIRKDWRWAYGMIATYGLRPHEIWHLDTTDLENGGITIRVIGGKTGSKKAYRVWPYHLEWIDRFNLRDVKIPAVGMKEKTKINSKLGGKVGAIFRAANIGFPPYNLRHAWAVRVIGFRLPTNVAAKMMGHSAKIHEETYEHWIPDSFFQQIFEAGYTNPDRPEPPEFPEQSDSDAA